MTPPLVLLPGTLCTETLFAPQMEALADVADLQALPLTTGATIAACATAILQKAPEHFALTGFSQGGVVALEIMRRAPQRVTKLCLISTNPRGSTPQNLETWARWQDEARAGFADIVRFHTEQVGTKQIGDVPEKADVRKTVEEMALSTGIETFLLQLKMLSSRTDSRPSLGKIGCPTLVIGGCQDRVTSPELQKEMREFIPHATLVPLESCGHYAPLEQPQRVSELLREWLTKADDA